MVPPDRGAVLSLKSVTKFCRPQQTPILHMYPILFTSVTLLQAVPSLLVSWIFTVACKSVVSASQYYPPVIATSVASLNRTYHHAPPFLKIFQFLITNSTMELNPYNSAPETIYVYILVLIHLFSFISIQTLPQPTVHTPLIQPYQIT